MVPFPKSSFTLAMTSLMASHLRRCFCAWSSSSPTPFRPWYPLFLRRVAFAVVFEAYDRCCRQAEKKERAPNGTPPLCPEGSLRESCALRSPDVSSLLGDLREEREARGREEAGRRLGLRLESGVKSDVLALWPREEATERLPLALAAQAMAARLRACGRCWQHFQQRGARPPAANIS